MSTSNVSRPSGRSRAGRLLALLSAAVVAASLLSVPISQEMAAASPGHDAEAGPRPVNSKPVAVTLITGDTVYWQDSGDGNPRVDVEPAPRDHPVEFQQSGSQDNFYIIPTDAMEHVAAGTLDEELFNIPGLIRQGLDDADADELPVIVTFDHNRSSHQLTQDASVLPATTNATAIEGINGAGVTVNRGNAGAFRKAILGTSEQQDATRTAGARRLEGAVKQVLLDQVLEIDLADSVPQIGASHAWDAGYTGEGITVAVLDTGIDAEHPDLAGQVVAAENFTDEPDATDSHGHGTHVASTIAGTGAASNGARSGVAPGADLLNGKVCRPTPDGQGICQTSWVMAGMEWATTQGADVVNMSLGGDPTDGTDPLSQLVNTLSVEAGALFVTSAGNRRCRSGQVGSPAAADAALAVGAVDKSDQLASFSSCGPRLGDHAVKPEITAPGVGIIAARAASTSVGSPIDDRYTAMQGTSMASPHVAGAAALLAQAHGLAGQRLKDVLVSTATDVGRLWYQQGVGRVDLRRALHGSVYAQGTVNFGQVADRAERSLTYTNHRDTNITLSLEAVVTDDRGQELDVADLSVNLLTVPAGGQASVTLTLDLPEGEDLLGGGVVTATGDGVSLRTGIGFGPIRHSLTIEVLDSQGNRVGNPTAADVRVVLTHDTYDSASPVGKPDYAFSTSEGVATGHLPTGTYTMYTQVNEDTADTGERLRGSVLIAVDVSIDADTAITLDARDAEPVQVSVPRKVDQRNHTVSLVRQRASDPGIVSSFGAGGWNRPMYVTPAPPSKFGFLALVVHWVLAEHQPVSPLPGVNGEQCAPPHDRPYYCYSQAPAYVYNLPFLYQNGIPNNLHEKITRHDLIEVPTQYHSDLPEGVLIERQYESYTPFPCGIGCGGAQTRMWIKPGDVTEYFLADDRFTWIRLAVLNQWPDGANLSTGLYGQISSDWFPAAEASHTRADEHWFAAPLRVGAADLREEYFHTPRSFERFATASRGGVDGNQFIPGYQIMDNTRGHFDDVTSRTPSFASWRMWNLETGAELEGAEFNPGSVPGVPAFTLAPGSATYRLVQTSEYPDTVGDLFQTGPATTTWTFTSHPSDAEVPPNYECPHPLAGQALQACQIQPLIQLEYDLGLDIHNRISARLPVHVFTVTAGHHSKAVDRAPVTSLTVQASFDEGDTWQDARVIGKPKDTWNTGGFLRSTDSYQDFRVVLKIPPLTGTNGFVTLRVQATDSNGGTIEQTIHRAYILK